MGKYILTNLETVPFKRKSFEGQLDRYLKVCIASVDNPQKVLLIMPLYGKSNGSGFCNIINTVRRHELGQDDGDYYNLLEPIDGEFVDVPSMHGDLYRVFTPDEAKYGICSPDKVWKAERLSTGKVKVYKSIRVFCHYNVDRFFGKQYVSGWFPQELYYRFLGYNYLKLADLTEPLQI